MRKRITWIWIVAMLVASPALGEITQIAEHISNPDFDAALTWNVENAHRWNVPFSGGTVNSWSETESYPYYVKENDAPAHSGEAFILLHTIGTGDWAGMEQPVDAELNTADTYLFTIQCRQSPLSIVAPVPMQVQIFDGAAYTTVATIGESSFGADWNEETVSFQWSGSTIAAGSWSIAFKVQNLGYSTYDGVNIDTIGVAAIPEPATISLLACGMVATLLRRKR